MRLVMREGPAASECILSGATFMFYAESSPGPNKRCTAS